MSTATTTLTPAPARTRTARPPLAALGRLTLGALLALAPLWIWFQVVEIGFFPPIGTIYAIGSLIMAGLVASRRRWAPGVAAAWAVFMLAIEASPTIDHLTHLDDIMHGHFSHYLLNNVMIPLAVIVVTAGIAATRQNYRRDDDDRPAPPWLRGALLATAGASVAANLLVMSRFYWS